MRLTPFDRPLSFPHCVKQKTTGNKSSGWSLKRYQNISLVYLYISPDSNQIRLDAITPARAVLNMRGFKLTATGNPYHNWYCIRFRLIYHKNHVPIIIKNHHVITQGGNWSLSFLHNQYAHCLFNIFTAPNPHWDWRFTPARALVGRELNLA